MSGLVSVVVPVYNAERWMADTLHSVFSQTYPHWELIMIDDGSSDASVAIAGDSVRDVRQRVELISTPNRGVSQARNLGISKSRGDYIAFLDADDLWYPDKLASQVDLLERDTDVTGAGCWFDVVDETNGHVLSTREVAWDRAQIMRWMTFECGGPLLPSTLLVRQKALAEVGDFDERLSTAADTDLAWRLVSSGHVATVPRPLARYRTSRNQMHRNLPLLRHDYRILYTRDPFVSRPALVAQCEANMCVVTGLMEIRRGAIGQAVGLWTRGLVTHPAATLYGVARRVGCRLRRRRDT